MTTPPALMAIPESAPVSEKLTGSGATTAGVKDSGLPLVAVTLAAVTRGALGAEIVRLITPLPMSPVFVSDALTVIA